MQLSTDTAELQSWAKAKQENEQEMLNKLNELFKDRFPTENMRKVVLAAFTAMTAEVLAKKIAPSKGAIEAEKNLAVWEKTKTIQPDWPGNLPADVAKQDQWVQRLFAMNKLLTKSFDQPNRLDCNDQSELIRVVGAWLEKGGGFGGYPDINKAWRVGIGEVDEGVVKQTYDKAATDKMKQYQTDLLKDPKTKKPDILPWEKGRQLAVQDARDKLQWGKDVRQREDPPEDQNHVKSAHHQVPAYLAPYWVKPKEDREAGTQMFQVNRDDLCKKIDLLFGLYKGATISGTTTDTVFVLETFGQQIGEGKQLHAGYYLFPIATIAASLHHTLVEVALSLALDGAIETYCVGFYTTLAPKGGFPQELEAAEKILKEYEKNARNRHFILWYDGDEGRPVGGVRFEGGAELALYKNAVNGKVLLPNLRSLANVPSKSDVAAFFRKVAPVLAGNYMSGESWEASRTPLVPTAGKPVKSRWPYAA